MNKRIFGFGIWLFIVAIVVFAYATTTNTEQTFQIGETTYKTSIVIVVSSLLILLASIITIGIGTLSEPKPKKEDESTKQ